MNAKQRALAEAQEELVRAEDARRLRSFVRERMAGRRFNPFFDRLPAEDREALREFVEREGRSDAKEVLADAKGVYGMTSPLLDPARHERKARELERKARYMEWCETRPVSRIGAVDVERDLGSMRMTAHAPSGSERVARIMQGNGFRWSSYLDGWTRALTEGAERSVRKASSEISLLFGKGAGA